MGKKKKKKPKHNYVLSLKKYIYVPKTKWLRIRDRA